MTKKCPNVIDQMLADRNDAIIDLEQKNQKLREENSKLVSEISNRDKKDEIYEEMKKSVDEHKKQN